MILFSGNNYRSVFLDAAATILTNGVSVSPRGAATLELQDVCLCLTDPTDRLPLLANRNANIFALVAETIWVLAGRSDLAFMAHYLPRLPAFSDDGISLSGAYGPRIRKWGHVDQLKCILETIRHDHNSRRAVISLFDPSQDHIRSRQDIPCNNWIQFSVFGNTLNMRVTSRSMDLIWGSTINVFEWTVILEIVASWLGLSVGTYHHYVGSLHIYETMIPRAEKILTSTHPVTTMPRISIDLPETTMDLELSNFFYIEGLSRSGAPDLPKNPLSSHWLRLCSTLLSAYNIYTRTRDLTQSLRVIDEIEQCDLQEMGRNYVIFLSRREA